MLVCNVININNNLCVSLCVRVVFQALLFPCVLLSVRGCSTQHALQELRLVNAHIHKINTLYFCLLYYSLFIR